MTLSKYIKGLIFFWMARARTHTRLLIYTHLKTLRSKLATYTHLYFTKKSISTILTHLKLKDTFATILTQIFLPLNQTIISETMKTKLLYRLLIHFTWKLLCKRHSRTLKKLAFVLSLLMYHHFNWAMHMIYIHKDCCIHSSRRQPQDVFNHWPQSNTLMLRFTQITCISKITNDIW